MALSIAIRGGRWLRAGARPITDPGILSALHRQAARLGLRFIPAVSYSKRVLIPTVVGILRPAVLLPVSVSTGLPLATIEAILTHELAHIRRYDHLLQLVQRLIEAVLFFHPAVWYLSRRVHAERENACDDIAVQAVPEPCDYASALLQAAELCILAPRTGESTTERAVDKARVPLPQSRSGEGSDHCPLRSGVFSLLRAVDPSRRWCDLPSDDAWSGTRLPPPR
jgi:hypothetical protein